MMRQTFSLADEGHLGKFLVLLKAHAPLSLAASQGAELVLHTI